MSTLLERLAAEKLIRCPACRDRVFIRAAAAACEACGRAYALENGALDLFGDYQEAAAPPPVDEKFADAVADKLGFPNDAAVRAKVARGVAASALATGDSAYTAEIAELADRLGITSAAPAPPRPAKARGPANVDVRARCESAFFGRHLPASTELIRTLRIRNLGSSRLSSQDKPPVQFSYRWLGVDGNVLPGDSLLSPLLIDIEPGAALPVMTSIRTPPAIGAVILRFGLVLGNGRWIDVEGGDVQVIVGPEDAPPIGNTGTGYSYAEDHALAIGMVAREMDALPRAGPRRVLEIGGGIAPQANALVAAGCDVVSLDISFSQSQLGALYFEHVDPKGRAMAFIACDAHEPPFPPGTFDCSMMFSSLHHFADPVRMLKGLAAVTRPEGFIAAMCEPCAPVRENEDYLRDLRKGINEQLWTIPEYYEIFERAGLVAYTGHVDGGSLKVFLRRRAA